jgi:uncharacterized DUF497 family protein
MHGLEPDEVDTAARGDTYWRKHRKGVVVIGSTADRIILVVLVPERGSRHTFRVITARNATRAEKRLFRRKTRP